MIDYLIWAGGIIGVLIVAAIPVLILYKVLRFMYWLALFGPKGMV